MMMNVSRDNGGGKKPEASARPAYGGRCNECGRQHRVCDYARPACSRCVRLGKECSYSRAEERQAEMVQRRESKVSVRSRLSSLVASSPVVVPSPVVSQAVVTPSVTMPSIVVSPPVMQHPAPLATLSVAASPFPPPIQYLLNFNFIDPPALPLSAYEPGPEYPPLGATSVPPMWTYRIPPRPELMTTTGIPNVAEAPTQQDPTKNLLLYDEANMSLPRHLAGQAYMSADGTTLVMPPDITLSAPISGSNDVEMVDYDDNVVFEHINFDDDDDDDDDDVEMAS